MQRRLEFLNLRWRCEAHRQSPGSRAPSYAGLELRPLPSTGVTRLPRYYGPVRHPGRPGLSLAGVRLEVTRLHRLGLPVLRRFSRLSTCRRHYPGGTAGSDRFMRGCQPLGIPQRRRPSPFIWRVGSHIKPFEACSAFTRVTACRLAAPPRRYLCLEGSDGFVTSTAAPIASGWSDRVCRAGLAPAGKTLPFHGAQYNYILNSYCEGGIKSPTWAVYSSSMTTRKPMVLFLKSNGYSCWPLSRNLVSVSSKVKGRSDW